MAAQKQETKILNWGLISTARINREVITPLNASKRNRLLGVASRDLNRAQEYARERSIPRAYGSYEEMLADPDIHVVYNPLPNHLHAEWTIKAAQAGKHVLCEKPLALSVAEVDAITAAARENRVVIMEAFMYRHHPANLKVKELVDGGEIGQLVLMRGEFSFELKRPDDIRWKAEMGGGSIWDVGCYPISYSMMIAGKTPVEVMGWLRMAESGVDRVFAGLLRFDDGVIAQVSSSFALSYSTFMEIRGTAGTIRAPTPFRVVEKPVIQVTKGDRPQTIHFPKSLLYQGEVENLYDAAVLGLPQRVTLEQSRAHIAVLTGLIESAQTNRPVLIR